MLGNIEKLLLERCLEHIKSVNNYFKHIQISEDFFTKEEGVYYDAILMRLQALSETIKKVETKFPAIIVSLNYPYISDLIKFRDLVSHHYEKLKHDIVFNICSNDLPALEKCINSVLEMQSLT